MPCRAVPCRAVPYRTVPYRTVPYRTVPYRTVPYRTVPYRVPYQLPERRMERLRHFLRRSTIRERIRITADHLLKCSSARSASRHTVKGLTESTRDWSTTLYAEIGRALQIHPANRIGVAIHDFQKESFPRNVKRFFTKVWIKTIGTYRLKNNLKFSTCRCDRENSWRWRERPRKQSPSLSTQTAGPCPWIIRIQ